MRPAAPIVSSSTSAASSSSSRSSSRSARSAVDLAAARQQMLELFGVPPSLITFDNSNIRVAYAKWVYAQQMIKQLPGMALRGEYTGGPYKESDITGIFFADRFVTSRCDRYFPLVEQHPDVLQWFISEGSIDKKAVWGKMRPGMKNLEVIVTKYLAKRAERERRKEEKRKEKKRDHHRK